MTSSSKLWDVGNGTGKYARPIKGYTESNLVADMVNDVRREYPGVFIIKTHGGNFQRAGLPDLYIQCTCPIWVEVKLPGGDTSAIQRKKLLDLKENGAYVGTCETREELLELIKEALFLESKRTLHPVGG